MGKRGGRAHRQCTKGGFGVPALTMRSSQHRRRANESSGAPALVELSESCIQSDEADGAEWKLHRVWHEGALVGDSFVVGAAAPVWVRAAPVGLLKMSALRSGMAEQSAPARWHARLERQDFCAIPKAG